LTQQFPCKRQIVREREQGKPVHMTGILKMELETPGNELTREAINARCNGALVGKIS
jgi:hypothetical protein